MIKYIFLILVLFLIAGCAVKDVAEETVVSEENSTVASVEQGVNDIDILLEDLDLFELDNLEQELEDISFE